MKRGADSYRELERPSLARRLARRWPGIAVLAAALGLWILPQGALAPGTTCGVPGVKAKSCPAALLAAKRKHADRRGDKDPAALKDASGQAASNGYGSGARDSGGSSPIAGGPNMAHDATPLGGLPGLVGALGMMTALGAAFAGRGAGQTAHTQSGQRPAAALAELDD